MGTLMLEIRMPSAVFDYAEIRKRVRVDYLSRPEPPRGTSASDTTSTIATPGVLSCDWCGKSGSDAENCPHNRNSGAICATKSKVRVGQGREMTEEDWLQVD
jgi:hypothetical protein